MGRSMRAVASGVLLLAGGLAGCSFNQLLWGGAGAEVIDAASATIEAAGAGEADRGLCDGASADFGVAADWEGRVPGEPERLNAEWFPDQARLGAQWLINTSDLDQSAKTGDMVPIYVYFGEENGALCVVDVGWARIDIGN